jgi:5-methylcytosine-specific restriction endonuclease McrA
MFNSEQEPLSLLIELTPKLAKQRFRKSVYEFWDHKCGYCGDEATSLDHIVPRFKSGSSNRNNLIPACRRCNANKASENMEAWYRKQDFFNEVQLQKIKRWTEAEVIDITAFHPYGDSGMATALS